MKIKKKFSDEISKALADHDEWAKPSFGNGIAGLVYGILLVLGVGLYQTVGMWASFAMFPSFVFFWLLCKYDSTLVSIWNEREKDRIVAQWVFKNSDRIVDSSSQPLDYEENLDGTNGDE